MRLGNMGGGILKLAGLRSLEEPTPDGRVEVGPTEPYLVPLTRANMVSQVRQEIDPDELEELVQSLIFEDGDGESYIGLIQPPTLGYFHRRELETYLGKLNRTWGSEHGIEQLSSLAEDEDVYLVVIAGHRRMLGIYEACRRLGIDPEAVDVVSHIKRGDELTFREGIKIQYRENFHCKPESWEDARAIDAILREGIESKEYETFADCARDLGIAAERVSRAYRFSTLPSSIQDLVAHNTLHYGRAILLTDIAVTLAFRLCRDDLDAETRECLLSRVKGHSLYLPEVWSLLSAQQRLQFLDELHAQSRQLIKQRSNSAAHGYSRDLLANWLSCDVLEFVMYTEAELFAKADREHITRARDEAVASLRILGATIREDQERLAAGRRAILARSPRVRSQMRLIFKALGVIDSIDGSKGVMSLDDLTIIHAGAAAAEELAEALVREQTAEPDPLTQALSMRLS